MIYSSPRTSTRWLFWSLLLTLAMAGAAYWCWLGWPVRVPDAASQRIACVSYAPFRQAGETPYDRHTIISAERIDADLTALSQRFDCVRTYSQAHGLDQVVALAGRHGMKVIMGIWLGADPQINATELAKGIATAQAHPQVLRGVIVGNEVLLRGDQPEEQLREAIHRVRAALPSDISVSYAEVWEFWLKHPALAHEVDYLTIHILPYWEDRPVPPESAVRHVAEVYQRMREAFPGKPIMIGETGWPSAGRPRHAARASLVNEARYLREFLDYAARVQLPYNVIEAFDQPWKRRQEGTVGGWWGIFDAHARPKFAMQGPVVEEPHWRGGLYAGVSGALLFLLVGLGAWRRCATLALLLGGFASGTALAWQARQMLYACRTPYEWGVSLSACVAALATALWLARALAVTLNGWRAVLPPRWLRFGWLFGLVWLDLLLVVDGRYRDFPLGVFALPCIGYLLLGLCACAEPTRREERFLAWVACASGVVLVATELGLNPSAWAWLALNLALGVAVLMPKWAGRLRY